MKLQGRFILAFAIIAFITSSLGLFSLSTYHKLRNSYLELEKVYVPSLTSVMEIRIALEELAAAAEMEPGDRRAAEKTSAAIAQLERNRDTHSAFLRLIDDSDVDKMSLHNIAGEINEIIALYEKLEGMSNKNVPARDTIIIKEKLIAKNTTLLSHIDKLIALHKKELRSAEARVRAVHDRGVRMVWGGIALSVGLAIIIGLYMASTVLAPLIKLRQGSRVIGGGDLDYRLNIRTGDEIEQLALEFNTMASHLKERQEKLVEAERHAAVGQATAQILHSTKNILNAFVGGRYMVDTALKKDDRDLLDRGWKIVKQGIERMSGLSKDILDYSRGNALDLKKTSVNPLVKEIAESLRASSISKGVVIEFSPDASLPDVMIDEKAIHTAVMNLVSNAVDACRFKEYPNGESGRVRIRTGRGKDGRDILIEIEDNGTGIPADVMEKIFTPFFSTKYSEGNGLGLSVTTKTIQEHGGKLSVDTKVGEGSSFRITLPYPAGR